MNPMKRDLELIRKILLTVEEHEDLEPFDLELEDYDENKINFHLQLLDEASFIETILERDETGAIVLAQPIRMTWKGFEFLDMARNNNVWEKSKKFVAQKSVSVSISMFVEIMKIILKDLLYPSASS